MKGQTDGFRDLYRIMQVHYLAEPEVIDGAYKRLSKKYHPDRNKEAGAEAKMKLINQAYGVLSDVKQRTAYDQIYQQHLAEKERRRPKGETQPEQQQRQMVEQAAALVKQYFAKLAKGDFTGAYTLISGEDQKYISQAAFLEWQSLVSGLFEIGDYHCVPFKTYRGRETGNVNFSLGFEFQISITERDRSSGKVNQVEISRLVVLEKSHLKIYLGYQDIQGIIAKFKEMGTEQTPTDEEGPDRQWLIKEVNREVARAARYNRPLALVLLEVVHGRLLQEWETDPEGYETMMNIVVRTITRNLRQTDSCGRWSYQRMMIILPETRFFTATKVVQKIFGILKALDDQNHGVELPTFCAGIVSYKQISLDELLDLLYSNTIAAKRRGEWRMVY